MTTLSIRVWCSRKVCIRRVFLHPAGRCREKFPSKISTVGRTASFVLMACTRSRCMSFLAASTQQRCPRTACPWYPHVIYTRVFSPGYFVTHVILTRMNAYAPRSIKSTRQKILMWTKTRTCFACHKHMRKREGRASQLQYRLCSALYVSQFSPEGDHELRFQQNCFFQIELDLRQLPLYLVLFLLISL